jgi:hypothetical protein
MMSCCRKSAFSAISSDFPEGPISERTKQKGSRRWFDPTQQTFVERVKAETNSLLDGNDQTKRQLKLSFIKIGRTAESQWILNRIDGTFLPRVLTRKLVQ